MSSIPLYLVPIIFYGIPAFCGAFFFSWLFKLERGGNMALFVIAPFCVWAAITFFFGLKSLSNLIIEPLILAAAILALTIVHGSLARWAKFDKKTLRKWLIIGALLIAFSVVLLVPELPE